MPSPLPPASPSDAMHSAELHGGMPLVWARASAAALTRLARASRASLRPLLVAVSCCLLGNVGCGRREPVVVPATGPLAPTHYLDEWFAVGTARCRLTGAEHALTEPIQPPAGRVAEDLHVVDATFACEDASGATVAVSTLPLRMSYSDEQLGLHPPSTRTKLGQALRARGTTRDSSSLARATRGAALAARGGLRVDTPPDHVLFEVPAGQDGLLRARSYDARSGDPTGARERRAARLLISPLAPSAQSHERADGVQGAALETLATPRARAEAAPSAASTVLAPWPRLHDRALDSFLDRLAHTLAVETPFETLSDSPEGHAAIASATELYQRALSLLSPKLLVVRAIESREGQPRLTLRLESGVTGAPLASFEFELVLHDGEPTIVRLLDVEATRDELDCALELRDLRARSERARSDSRAAVYCNALGVSLPGACPDADRALLKDALRIGTRCGRDGELGLDVYESDSAPSDFEVRLRRGRADGALDSAPRYTVTLTRSGQVRFDGQQWVAAPGAHEGRTSTALLSALSGVVHRLGWFERPAPDASRCASDERGDVISVRAGGRERSVRDRAGCRGAFSADELSLLRRAITRVSALDVWTVPALSPFAPDAEIWVVAAE